MFSCAFNAQNCALSMDRDKTVSLVYAIILSVSFTLCTNGGIHSEQDIALTEQYYFMVNRSVRIFSQTVDGLCSL